MRTFSRSITTRYWPVGLGSWFSRVKSSRSMELMILIRLGGLLYPRRGELCPWAERLMSERGGIWVLGALGVCFRLESLILLTKLHFRSRLNNILPKIMGLTTLRTFNRLRIGEGLRPDLQSMRYKLTCPGSKSKGAHKYTTTDMALSGIPILALDKRIKMWWV